MVQEFLADVVDWAKSQSGILGVALVGSHARGEARQDSDIDLVIISTEPDQYIKNTSWVNQFGKVKKMETEDWGKVTSLRVWYQDNSEVEFGLTDVSWSASPLDLATEEVIKNGFEVMFERTNCFYPIVSVLFKAMTEQRLTHYLFRGNHALKGKRIDISCPFCGQPMQSGVVSASGGGLEWQVHRDTKFDSWLSGKPLGEITVGLLNTPRKAHGYFCESCDKIILDAG